MPKENRVSEADLEARIELICELLTRPGIPKRRKFIIEYVRNKTDWNIERAQIDNYISKATKRLKETPIDKDLERVKMFLGYEFLEKQNIEIEDWKEVRALWESKAKLFGLNEVVKNVNENINYNSELTEEKIKEIKNQLNSKY